MYLLKSIAGKNCWLILIFAPLLLVVLSTSTNEVFAMGDSPGACKNRYDGLITSFIINNGTQTFDAIANPGVTFEVNWKNSYNVNFVIHTQNASSQNNTSLGTTWYHDYAYGFASGHCVPDYTTTIIGPNQDVTISRNLTHPYTISGPENQTVPFSTFSTLTSPVTYKVQWMGPPSYPTNLSAAAVSSSQINLSWTAPYTNGGSAITSYNIYRGTTSGGEGTTPIGTVSGSSLSYTDTGLTNGQTYFYKVTAINSFGESAPSNEASAATTNGIVLNGIQTTSGTVSSSPYQITLANFNAGTGTNRVLVVGVEANNNNVASVTFGGVQLTRAAFTFTNNDAEFWYLTNPTGTGNIVVTMAGSTSVVVGAYSFSGVDQTNPIPTSITNHNTAPSSPTISITTKYPNSWVIDSPSIYGGQTLGSPTCTQQWDINMPSAITGASSSTIKASPGSVTCSWTASTGDLWDDAAIEVKASG